jgi:outer membrane protein assembly factor BamB
MASVPPAPAADISSAQNWPEWRGPLHTGAASTGNPPVSWSETNNIKWKVAIPGSGSATPIIWGDQIFIQTAIPAKKSGDATAAKAAPVPDASPGGPSSGRRRGGGGMQSEKPTDPYQFVLLSLDRQTGKTLWQKVVREEVPHEGVRENDGTFASPSPVTDGKHIFADFGSRGIYCLDLQGNLVWSRDLGRMRIKNEFGEGSSPALSGNALILNWDNEDGSFIAALDKKTGDVLWKTPRDEKTSWATPLVVENGGRAEVITCASGKIRSYDPASGKLLWECAGLTANVIPTPVAANGLVYCASGFRGNALLAIQLGRDGDLTGTDAIVWKLQKSTPYVPSPLLYGGKLYFLASNNGIYSVVDAKTGQIVVEAERLEALKGVYSSPVGAGGHVYIAGRNGAVAVLNASAKVEVLAVNQLDEKFDASPAISGNELFLRGKDHLYCIATAR